MNLQRFRLLLRILSWLCVGGIVVMALIPGSMEPLTAAGDKAEHVFAYFVAVVLGYIAYPRRIGRVAGLLGAFAIFLEALQYLVPGRSASILDCIASLLGIIVGLALIMLLRRPLAHFARNP